MEYRHENLTFNFPKGTVGDINKIIKILNPKKEIPVPGPNEIPIKIIKTALNVIDSHLRKIMIKDLDTNKFSENAKTALVMPFYKKNDMQKKIKITDLRVF